MIRWTTLVSRKRITYQTEHVGTTKADRADCVSQDDVTQRVKYLRSSALLLVLFGSLQKTYCFHPQWPIVQKSNSSWIAGYLKMEPKGYSETTDLRHVTSEKSEGLNYTATEARILHNQLKFIDVSQTITDWNFQRRRMGESVPWRCRQ